MRITATALVVFIIFFNISFVVGKLSAAEHNPSRKTFLQAEKQLWQTNSPRFKELYNQLHYYPLQPYLDQQILIDQMSLAKVSEIDSFLKKFRASPLDWRLRKKWLNYLVKKNMKRLFLEFYKPTSNVPLTCMYYRYQIETGVPKSVVLPQVTKLWLVGKSQDKKCDPLFKQWQESGYQTDKVVWQRIKLAADGGKHTLIPYLTKLLPENERYLGSLWKKVRRDPSYIHRLNRFPEKSAKEAEIMVYGLKRLIWRNQKLALTTYEKSLKVFTFSEEQKRKVTNKFAVALASKNHKEATHWLDKVDAKSLTKEMVEFRLSQIIKQQDWQRLITELVSLPERYRNALQWKYWYARALIETDENVRGKDLLKLLANERHYYGFLAASTLKIPVNLQDKPIEITELEKETVLKHPAAKRAFELFYLNRANQARREWNFWLESLNNRQKLVASKLANEAGWYDRAIFTLSRVGYLDDVDLRFPQAFEEKINQHANIQKINPAWAFAITRRESSFMPDAHSAVGAKGLMQLMPRTAKQLENKKVKKANLLDSSSNIKLGTKYLKQLLDMSKGNQVIATASYNAGPYRVKAWLKNSSSLPADIWIETIPYKETREYVKSVLAYQQIYQTRVGQLSSVFDQVINMRIPDK
ncbi:MAG: transglycosylase SLT domain-containing protein [Colwellia sp.]|nr:transglycosylase SLT domain-containing protein [Colwellia sp.]